MHPLAVNLDLRPELGVSDVEMWRAVLVVVHGDDEAMKAAEFGHATTSR